MQRHSWMLLFHDCVVEQLQKLSAAEQRAKSSDPQGFEDNANVKLFRALSRLILEVVPGDPARDEFRQGKTLERITAIGGAPRLADGFGCFFATTRRQRSSSSLGSTTNRRCARLEPSRTRMRCSRRCSGKEIRLTTGQRLFRPVKLTGPRGNSGSEPRIGSTVQRTRQTRGAQDADVKRPGRAENADVAQHGFVTAETDFLRWKNEQPERQEFYRGDVFAFARGRRDLPSADAGNRSAVNSTDRKSVV